MKTLRSIVDPVVDTTCASLMLALVLATLLQVINRYALKLPIPWTEEAARFLSVWMALMGSARCVREKSHIEIDLLYAALPPRLQWLLSLGINVVFVAFCCILLWEGTSILKVIGIQIAPATRISMKWVYAAGPVSAAVMIYYLADDTWRLIRSTAPAQAE